MGAPLGAFGLINKMIWEESNENTKGILLEFKTNIQLGLANCKTSAVAQRKGVEERKGKATLFKMQWRSAT